MALGPIIIFDKSALESLNPDEACWLEAFYICNITPLFFVETLADLKEEMARGRSPEQVVGNIAYKTPPSGRPNVHHNELCIADLLGYKIEMRRVPVIAGGRSVATGNQTGFMFESPPEMQALQRWQEGAFLDIEYQFASQWRRMLSSLQLAKTSQWVLAIAGNLPRPKTLEGAKELADRMVAGERQRYGCLKAMCSLLNIPSQVWTGIIRRWKAEGGPSLIQFAPYAAHVFAVDIFFSLATSAGLISADRASNKIDIAYLYYLPFCMVFASKDNLHKRTVPLFIGSDQLFVDGMQLKDDLSKLDAYYSQLPEEVREKGIMSFAHEPPMEGEYLTAKLWDRFLPKWREIAKSRGPRSAEKDAKLLAHMKRIKEAVPTRTELYSEDADFMMLSSMVPIRMGKWRLLPPEVEKNQDN
jgi:hypothetical protein